MKNFRKLLSHFLKKHFGDGFHFFWAVCVTEVATRSTVNPSPECWLWEQHIYDPGGKLQPLGEVTISFEIHFWILLKKTFNNNFSYSDQIIFLDYFLSESTHFWTGSIRRHECPWATQKAAGVSACEQAGEPWRVTVSEDVQGLPVRVHRGQARGLWRDGPPSLQCGF